MVKKKQQQIAGGLIVTDVTDVKVGSPELVQIANYLKPWWSPNTVSYQNLFRDSPRTALRQPSLVHYIWTAHIVMKAITTNVGAGFIMEKKLRRNCFSHFFFFFGMLLDKEFEEWDGPVAEQLNWIGGAADQWRAAKCHIFFKKYRSCHPFIHSPLFIVCVWQMQ